MMLVWLLPLFLLSNAIGDYGCWKLLEKTLFKFLDDVGIDPQKFINRNKNTDLEASRKTISIPIVSELECSGAVLHSCPASVRKAVLALISVLPITMACATAFTVDYTAPTWFSCRAILIIGSFALWLLSSAATVIMRASLGRRHLWLVVLLKDIVVATPILVLILLSSCGYFNSCYCSSGVIVRGGHAQVDLNPIATWPLNDHVIYPVAVSTGLVLQMMVPILVRYIQLQGFKTMWWSDLD